MAQPKAVSNFIARHPVLSFISLTLIISYLFGIPFQTCMLRVVAEKHEVLTGLAPRIMVVYGPAFSAMTVILFSSGVAGLKNLFGKLILRSTHMPWVVGIPITAMSMTFVSFLIGGMQIRDLNEFLINHGHLLILQFLGQLLVVGIGEELGWRGWLLPHFVQRYAMGASVILVILIWGAWHFPIFMSPSDIVIPWCLMLIALSLIMTWLWYKVKGNVFVLAVAHASVNAPVVFLENRLRDLKTGDQLFISGWEILGYAYLMAAVILLVSTFRLWTVRLQLIHTS